MEDSKSNPRKQKHRGKDMAKVDGVLLRSPDGNLYFMPKEDLEPFLLPSDEQTSLENAVTKHSASPSPAFELGHVIFGALAQRPVNEPRILLPGVEVAMSDTVVAAAHGRLSESG